MRSDPARRAGGSAGQGYRAALRRDRRRRLLRRVLLSAAAVATVAVVVLGAGVWALAPVLGAAAVLLALRPDPDPGRWARGAEGEAATAALLSTLPGRRWRVFHDRAVPGHRANLDHVAIGPSGVWLVDSKAFRAPLRAGWRSVRAGGHPVDTAAAAWEAEVVAEALEVAVRPVLAVHGTGLGRRGRRVGGVPVLAAAALVGRLRRRRGSARLRRSEVEALALEFDARFPPAGAGRGAGGRVAAGAGRGAGGRVAAGAGRGRRG